MKKVLAVITMALLSSVAMAHDKTLGGNPDLYGSALLEHGPGDPTGNPAKGEGDQYASHMADPAEHAPNPNAKVVPWDGKADQDPDGNMDHGSR